MYSKMMVPVDLSHLPRLEKALTTAADLAKHYGTPVCYVGVTAETPGQVAHNPTEYARKLEEFGKTQAARHGMTVTTLALPSHDPTTDLDDTLLKAVKKTGADLVVMASHVPGLAEHLHIFSSNAGYVASHAKVSVFVIR